MPGSFYESPAPVIAVAELRKSYPKDGEQLEVLRGVEISVEQGEFCCIVGPSGAGKSTLLHLLGGLDQPTAGHVFVAGRDLGRLSPRDLARLRNREIGFVFQLHHLLPEFSALENVAMPAVVGGQGGDPDVAIRAWALLRQVGLGDRMGHSPGELSGGERQRVALARALMTRPRVVLADEPTGNLDPITASAIHEIMWSSNRENGQTFVVATHNQALADRATRLYHLREGLAVRER